MFMELSWVVMESTTSYGGHLTVGLDSQNCKVSLEDRESMGVRSPGYIISGFIASTELNT
jgi:hypothetical protein